MATRFSPFDHSTSTLPLPATGRLNAWEPSPARWAETGVAPQFGARRVPSPISLMLVDDNLLLREALAAIIQRQPGLRVMAVAAEADEALQKVRASSPDVVIVDYGLATADTLRLTASVHGVVPAARVIVMGVVPGRVNVADYVRAGVSGFILKGASSQEFSATIRAVAGGAEVLPAALTHGLFSQITRHVASRSDAQELKVTLLTPRERQVVGLLEEGMSNKEIARRLQVAVHTVKTHVHNVLEKFALRSRLELVAFTSARGGMKDTLR